VDVQNGFQIKIEELPNKLDPINFLWFYSRNHS
jgi:hypothetical protein